MYNSIDVIYDGQHIGSIGMDGNKPVAMWIREGNTDHKLHDSNLGIDLDVTKEFLRGLWRNKIKLCSGCNARVEKYAGIHFSGGFCVTCWELYKRKYNRICSMCGKPEYVCYC
jgi:hypothetical protein